MNPLTKFLVSMRQCYNDMDFVTFRIKYETLRREQYPVGEKYKLVTELHDQILNNWRYLKDHIMQLFGTHVHEKDMKIKPFRELIEDYKQFCTQEDLLYLHITELEQSVVILQNYAIAYCLETEENTHY